MAKQIFSPIGNVLEAFEVRSIRNECKSFMTNNNNDIGIIKQFVWYFWTYLINERKHGTICYLFRTDKISCGYGLIRKSSGKYWITGGLKESFRGRGLGKILFENLIKSTPSSSVWLEVKNSNDKAISLYKSFGFQKMHNFRSKKGISVMRLIK